MQKVVSPEISNGQESENLFVNIKWLNSSIFQFELDAGHFLFSEHFPGFPVVPASLIVGLLDTQIRKAFVSKTRALCLNNIRFNRPMVPNQLYQCHLQTRSDGQFLFTIRNSETAVYTKGLIEYGRESAHSEENKNVA